MSERAIYNAMYNNAFNAFTPNEIARMTGEEYEKIRRQMGAKATWYASSHLSTEILDRIENATRQDPRILHAWQIFTQRPNIGLNDRIADSFMTAIYKLLRQWDHERDQLNTRNLDNIRSLGNAAHDVVSAFEDARSRGDVAYMEAAVEELDAALYEVTKKESS